MAAPFLKEFDLNDIRFTSIVLDPDEFDAFCDELKGLFDVADGGQRTNDSTIARIKEFGNLPMMAKGTKTEKFFKRWGVKTDKMGVVKRGTFNKWFGNTPTND